MKSHLCLFTDSLDPSGMGEHMLALCEELSTEFAISIVAPPSVSALDYLRRAASMGIQIFPWRARSAAEEGPLRRWLQIQKVDIFHCHAGIGWEGHHGIYAARAAGIPLVFRTEHLPYLLTQESQRQDHQKIVSLVDRVICVSEEARDTFVAQGFAPAKLCTVVNGIKPPRPPQNLGVMPPGLEDMGHGPILLTVGRLIEQKGHRFLLEAIPEVIANRPDVRFMWVGTGPLEAELRDRVSQLGLGHVVRLLGNRTDLPDLMEASTLFVLPSLFEGLPLAVLESMAVGLPVLGTRVCGTSEAVEDGVSGALVPAACGNALADGILRALRDKEQLQRWSAAGRQRFRDHFDARRMARETAKIYREAAQFADPVAHAQPRILVAELVQRRLQGSHT